MLTLNYSTSGIYNEFFYSWYAELLLRLITDSISFKTIESSLTSILLFSSCLTSYKIPSAKFDMRSTKS